MDRLRISSCVAEVAGTVRLVLGKTCGGFMHRGAIVRCTIGLRQESLRRPAGRIRLGKNRSQSRFSFERCVGAAFGQVLI